MGQGSWEWRGGELLSVGHGLSLSLSSSQCWMRLMDWIWGV